MSIETMIKQRYGELVSLIKTDDNVYQIYTPFFHEDGDMISMYLQLNNDSDKVIIRDFGNALMRLSYTFDINTEKKEEVITNIVKSNSATLEEGELLLETNINYISQAIFQFSQIVAKVSCVDILRREVIKSLFYEYLNDFITTTLTKYSIRRNSIPTPDNDLIVDYELNNTKPIYIFGVNDNSKASKVIINCLTFQALKNRLRV